MSNAAFLQQLTTLVQSQQIMVATDWATLPDAALAAQPSPGCWSALECIDHLNRYSRYYNPALTAALERSSSADGPSVSEPLRYSWLGRKSVELVRPSNTSAHKTLARMNPSSGRQPQREVMQEFIGHQTRLLELLEQAAPARLNHWAVPIEFFRLLKLRLGEAFEFVVQHQERHVLQASRAIEQSAPSAEILH